MWEHGKEVPNYKPRGEDLEEIKPTDTLILDFDPICLTNYPDLIIQDLRQYISIV